jgi:hypothetical protein
MSENTQNEAEMRNNVDTSVGSIQDVLDQDVLMQAVIGEIYKAITTGDDVAPASKDNFFAWVTPGYPVEPKDFEFASLGLTGETIDTDELKRRVKEEIDQYMESRKASGAETIEAPDTKEIVARIKDDMQKENQQRRTNAADDFASMVDFIPDVSGDDKANLKTMYGEGTLSDVYESILQMSQVKHSKLSEQEEKIIEKNRELLGEKTEEVTDILGEKTIQIKPSPLMEAYNRHQEAYTEAVNDYFAKMITGTLGDLKERNLWVHTAPTYRKKVETAKQNWIVSGYKNQVESLSAQLAQIEDRDFSIFKQKCKDLMEAYKKTNAFKEFYYTTFTPSNFVKSEGWTQLSIYSSKLGQATHADSKSHSRSITTKSGSMFHKHSTTNTESSSSCNISSSLKAKSFTLSFEFCQVRIVRPWFKESFLTSKYWRFDPTESRAGQELSDGGNPPKGIMPAYPTSMFVVRNLSLRFDSKQDASSFSDEFKSKSANYSAGVNIGFFNISAGGGYSNSDSSGRADSDLQMSKDGQSITIPGMQVIGFNCHVLDKAPNPSPDVSDEDWI